MEQGWLTTADAAKWLGVSPVTLYRLMHESWDHNRVDWDSPAADVFAQGERVERAFSSTWMRNVPWLEVAEAALRDYTNEEARPREGGWAEVLQRGQRVGRRGHTDRFWAGLSIEYDAMCDSGSRSPTKDLAEKYGLRRQTVANLLHEAAAPDKQFRTASGHDGRGGRALPKAYAAISGELKVPVA